MDEQNEKFVVDSDAKAEWALRKKREHMLERDRLVAVSNECIDKLNEEIAKYKASIKEAEDECHFACEYLDSLLRGYFETVPHKQNKAKTNEEYKLPSGKLVYHYDSYKLEQSDDLLDWCKKNAPEYVKTDVKESVAWADLKGKLEVVDGQVINTETGEVVPAVNAAPIPAEFEVKIKGEK